MRIRHEEDYRVLRRSSYPKIGDQLDAIYKLALAMEDAGLNLPLDTEQWMEQVTEVKQKFPKP